MWSGLTLSSRINSHINNSLQELFETVSRRFILLSALLYVLWHVTASVTWSGLFALPTYALSLVFLALVGWSLYLLERNFLATQIVWVTGLVIIDALAVILYQAPMASLLLILLPLMAVISINIGFGLVIEGLCVVIVTVLFRSGWVPNFDPLLVTWVIVGGCLTTLIGWMINRTLLQMTESMVIEYRKARQDIKEAREQRVELKQIQEDLQNANNELSRLANRLKAVTQIAEEAKRTKEDFLANVSHELRTPLNMIIGFSEMILRSPQVYGSRISPKLMADITTIHRNSQHLSRLVNDVLDLSQVEAGRMTLHKEWVDLTETVRSAIVAIRPLFESKLLFLNVELPPDLQQVFCDNTRIRQVLLNLLSNAGRFTEKGGVTLKISMDENQIVVSVVDTGPGIDPQDQARIFDPFEQLDQGMSRRVGGNGLGLSICKRLIEMHDGRMWLESQVGIGTSFFFSLPLEKRMPVIPELHNKLRWFSNDSGLHSRLRKRMAPDPRVLPRLVVLENENTLSNLLSRYSDGLEVVTVKDHDSALKELLRSPAQAILINSPIIDDHQTIAVETSGLPFNTPIIQCWTPGSQELNRSMGILRYLVKPVSGELLLSAIIESSPNINKVLLVEDNLDLQQLLVRQLLTCDRKFRILRAGTGEQALNMLREKKPDLMLLDMTLPDRDGYQLLLEKNSDPEIRAIPVMVISAKDPNRKHPIESRVTLIHPGGLSIHELLACVLSFSEVFLPDPGLALPEFLESQTG